MGKTLIEETVLPGLARLLGNYVLVPKPQTREDEERWGKLNFNLVPVIVNEVEVTLVAKDEQSPAIGNVIAGKIEEFCSAIATAIAASTPLLSPSPLQHMRRRHDPPRPPVRRSFLPPPTRSSTRSG